MGANHGCWDIEASKMRCTKAEYVEIAKAEKKTIWITDYLEELGMKQHEKILYRDRVPYSW